MTTFTFSTNDVNEAMVMMNALIGVGVKVDVAPTTTVADTDDKANETVVSSTPTTPYTVGEVQAVLNKLSVMSKDELADVFGSGNDKPYRVIKNVGLENAIKTLGAGSTDVDVTLDDALAAIQYIIKDVSVGGMSHDTMEDLFGVRTSKNLFKENSLDVIVRVLKEGDLI